jgi:hypothetical protein
MSVEVALYPGMVMVVVVVCWALIMLFLCSNACIGDGRVLW